MSNKITITLQAKTDDAKKNIASLEKDIKSLTTSIKSQSEIQKTHYSNIKSALNEQNKENENFAKRRQQIIQDTITSNRQLEESMKAKSNPLKEQLNAIEQAKSKMQNEQKALLSSLGGDSTKANEKQKEQLNKREQDLSNHINEIKRLKKELTEVTRSQDYQDLSNQISTNKQLKAENLAKLQAEKQLYNQSAKLKIDNLKQEQNLNAQGLADNRKVLSEKQALLQKEINVYKEKEQALRKSILGMSFGITPEASKSAYLAKTSQANTQSLVNERAAVDATEKSYSNLANTTIRYLRWAGTIAGVFYGVQRAWQMTLGAGIDVNKMIEDNTSGIAALISANTRMALSNGQMVNSYEKFQIASGKAASIMEELRVASTKTYATFPQLTSIYQQMIGHTMSMGDSMGKTVNEISTNTIELSKILSNIGGAIGMEMQKVNEEARSIISGSASTDSLIAMMVFGSPTQANEAMKKAKENGTNGVKDMLMGVLESYKVLEGVKTYTRAQLELQDQISRSQELLSKPTYNALKDVYMDLSIALKQNEKDFQIWGERLLNISKEVVSYADDVAKVVIAYKSLQLAMGTASAFATGLGAANAAAALTFTGMVVPIMAVVSAYMAYDKWIGSVLRQEESLAKLKGKKESDLNASSTGSVEEEIKIIQKGIVDIIDKRKELSAVLNNERGKFGFKYSEEEKKSAQESDNLAKQEYDKLLQEKKAREDILTTRANILKKQEEINKAQGQEAELLTRLGVDKKLEEERKSFRESNEKEIVKLTKQRVTWNEDVLRQERELAEVRKQTPNDIEYIAKKEKEIAEEKKDILALDGKIAEVNEQTAKKQTKENDTLLKQEEKKAKTLLEINRDFAEQEGIRAEIALIESGMFNDEKLKEQMSLLNIARLAKEYELLTNIEDKEKVKLELLREGLKYEQLISIEQQLRGDKSETAQDLITLNDQLLGIEKNITSAKQEAFYSQLALTAVKVQDLLLSKQITQAEADTFNKKLQGIAETRAAQDEYQKNLTAGIKDFDDAIKNIQNQTVTIDIKFEGFNEATKGFASMANGIIDISNANSQVQEQEKILAETRKNYPNDVAKIGAEEKKLTKIKSTQFNTTIDGYGDMIGAIGNFYDEDDHRRERQQKLAEAFHYIKMAQQLSEMAQSTAFTSLFVAQESAKSTAAGVTAVATAAQSSPWTGFATAAAMIALLASIGLALGGSSAKTSVSSDSLSSMKANTGTGTVLGDTEAQSESIVNALSILEDFAEPQYQTLLSMNKYLSAIASGIGGVSSLLVQEGGYAFGSGYQSTDTGWKNNVGGTTSNALSWGALGASGGMGLASMGVAGIGGAALSLADSLTGGKLNSVINKIPIVGDLNKLAGSVTSKILGGIFGKTSVSSKMKDSGMYFADQLLTEATKNFVGSAYQTIETTTTKKSWFSKSTDTSSKTSTSALSDQTNKQFTMIIDNLYKTTLLAGDALDTATSTVEDRLKNFVVSIGKISLYKKSGDEIQETLEAIFGKLGDQIASAAFPLLNSFQAIGEGMFETMTRVATGMEEAEYYIERLGYQFQDISYWEIINKSGDVGFEALLQSIVKTDEATYGLNNNLVQIIGSLNSTAEELYGAYTALDTLRDILKFLNVNTETLSFNSIRGAGSIDALAAGIEAYTQNFLTEAQQLSLSTTLLQKEFNKLNLAMPVGKDGFTSLINGIDKTTASGQELYGRLIILSESFATVADSVQESIDSLESTLKDKSQTLFDNFTTTISKMFDAIVSMAESTESTILGIKTSDTGNTQETIYNQFVEYNKLLAKFDAAQLSGDTTTAQSAYSSLLGLSTTLSEAGYQTEIVGLLEDKLAGFNTTKDILRVNVVDGLGELLNLTESQTSQLKLAARDGAVTNSELSSIAGLTETQLSSIKEFASNSNYFSTEDTLSNLEAYAAAQLEVLRTAQAEEKEALSKKTFTTGDYIGTQEKIDISKALGVSYDTAKPMVEQLQSLSVSTDLKKDLSSILGYSGYELDTTKIAQLKSLSQYLSPEIASALSGIESESIANIEQRNIFEAAKSDFYKRLTTAQSTLDSLNSAIASAENSYAFWDAKVAKTDNGSSNYKTYKANRAAAAQALWVDLPPQINSYTALLSSLYEEKQLKGYAMGGYTGNIPTNAIAGFVHGQEYVLDSNATSQINSIGSVTDMVSRYTSTNGFTRELIDIKTVLLDQSRYFNGIISELKNQVRILTESRDIQNESLVVLEAIEEVA